MVIPRDDDDDYHSNSAETSYDFDAEAMAEDSARTDAILLDCGPCIRAQVIIQRARLFVTTSTTYHGIHPCLWWWWA